GGGRGGGARRGVGRTRVGWECGPSVATPATIGDLERKSTSVAARLQAGDQVGARNRGLLARLEVFQDDGVVGELGVADGDGVARALAVEDLELGFSAPA